MSYQYTLDPSPKKHVCPNCGEKRFVKFINTETGEYLPDHVGKCDRSDNCCYFYHASEFLKENPGNRNYLNVIRKPTPPKQPRYINQEFVENSLIPDDGNTFIKYLGKIFGKKITIELVRLYQIGTCNERWPGAAIFWLTDKAGRVRSGQVKHFDLDGHTGKYLDNEGKIQSKTGWVHRQLEYKPNRPPWLTSYLENPECWPCLFGEHLLDDNPDMPVALVEAPKTAIISSVYFPQYVWLAVGSKGNFTTNRPDRLLALKGRTTCLFPDLNAYEDWNQKAASLSHICNFIISDYLEKNATTSERERGLDLADYLTRFPISEFSTLLR